MANRLIYLRIFLDTDGIWKVLRVNAGYGENPLRGAGLGGQMATAPSVQEAVSALEAAGYRRTSDLPNGSTRVAGPTPGSQGGFLVTFEAEPNAQDFTGILAQMVRVIREKSAPIGPEQIAALNAGKKQPPPEVAEAMKLERKSARQAAIRRGIQGHYSKG